MTCQELDLRLDDWLDGALTGDAAREVESHLAGCAACRERERELRQLLAHAAALPRSLAPARDLWPGIAERIGRGWSFQLGWGARGFQPLALAAAAGVVVGLAALVLPRLGPERVRTVTMPAASPSATTLVAAGSAADPVLAQAEREYEDAAKALLEALQRHRGLLPAEDLARVESNLQVIDRALAEVREALVKDPKSPELNRMLVATHRKKVDVLRRVVRLSTAL
ncbi:MAG: zf-HC2 domain-containing protein [Burkholderiales bacterium]